MKKDSLSIRTSTWFYAKLLAIYPLSFQEKYGREMLLIFRDVCRRENGRNGISGLVIFWLEVIIDLASTALQEHISEVRMLSTNQNLIRFTGILGALGGILSIIIGVVLIRGLGEDVTVFQAAMFILTFLLIAVGSVGYFFAGRNERDVNAALGVLLIGAIIGVIGPILMAADIGLGWILWGIGLLIQGAGLVLLGVTARKNTGFVRPAWLPLALGISIFTLMIVGITLSQSASDTVQQTLGGLTLSLLGASWMILCLMLLRGSVRTDAQPPTAA